MFQDLKSIIAQYFLIKFFFVRGESNNPVGFLLWEKLLEGIFLI